ncbi:MAG TPA: hypothetical protein VGC84_12545 [Ilumatobacteraceae bacterium]
MFAFGVVLLLVGFALIVPRGAVAGSTAARNVRVGPRVFTTAGFAGLLSRRRRLLQVLAGLAMIAGAVVCFKVASTGSEPVSEPTAVATSSTTAEEARAIDGPVMRYQDTSAASGDLLNSLEGALQFDHDCLYLAPEGLQDRFPILWPAETRWDAANRSVVSPAGNVMRVGDRLEGRGGYFYLSDINLLAGGAARNMASRCTDNVSGQIIVVQNNATAIGAGHA